MKLEKTIKSIPDYPKKGILFRDITSLLENKRAFNTTIKRMYKIAKKLPHNKLAAIESRGFVFASVLAFLEKKPLILLRKKINFQTKEFLKNLHLNMVEQQLKYINDQSKKMIKY